MSYVDGYFDKNSDVIRINERTKDGRRVLKDYPARYTVYYKDVNGKYKSITGDPLSKIVCKSTKDLYREQRIYGDRLYEGDLNVVYQTLAAHYLNVDPPKLHTLFFDIETDFCPVKGYSNTDDAWLPIISIAVYQQWCDNLVCLALPPKTLTMAQAAELVKEFPNTYLFNTEAELLDEFINLLDDADVISGWNSESYDIPYTVNRIKIVLGAYATTRLSLYGKAPKPRTFENFGKESNTYDFTGRVHMDSMELYRKFTFEERHSYSLNAIAEYELGEQKTDYDGTLSELYNNDFRTFIEYNRQDVILLDKIDKKRKFLDLANTIAHKNTVLLPATTGSVAVTEQAIINEAHRLGVVVPKRPNKSDAVKTKAAGAYVAYPIIGMHVWIGSYDINSLYPSTIRALNMGPDTIIGQLRQTYTDEYIAKGMKEGKSFAEAWEGLFGSLEYTYVIDKDPNMMITIDWEIGQSDTMTAADAFTLLYESDQPWMLSANGTIFTYEREGIIPGLLKRWYTERVKMKATEKKFKNLMYGISITGE